MRRRIIGSHPDIDGSDPDSDGVTVIHLERESGRNLVTRSRGSDSITCANAGRGRRGWRVICQEHTDARAVADSLANHHLEFR
jgi:hypothetical protein